MYRNTISLLFFNTFFCYTYILRSLQYVKCMLAVAYAVVRQKDENLNEKLTTTIERLRTDKCKVKRSVVMSSIQ